MTYQTDVQESGDRQIVIIRKFAASPDLVFDALTVPALLKRWMKGPDGWSLDVCDFDLREGGLYRQVWVGPDGARMGMVGEFRTIDRPTHLVSTQRYEGAEDEGMAMAAVELRVQGSETIMTTTITYDSRETRDQAIASNMAAGVAASYKWLDAVFDELETEKSQ